MPVMWCLANPKLGEREVLAALLEDNHGLIRNGQILLADKGFAGKELKQLTAAMGLELLRPDRKDETYRNGNLGGVRQRIESVNQTLKVRFRGAAGKSNAAATPISLARFIRSFRRPIGKCCREVDSSPPFRTALQSAVQVRPRAPTTASELCYSAVRRSAASTSVSTSSTVSASPRVNRAASSAAADPHHK
jgi:hypothetical protein